MHSFQGRRLLLALATVAAVLVGCAEKGTAENSGEQGSVGGSPAAAVTRATSGGQTSTSTSNGAIGGVIASPPDYLPGL